jgi:hypothetical protein
MWNVHIVGLAVLLVLRLRDLLPDRKVTAVGRVVVYASSLSCDIK